MHRLIFSIGSMRFVAIFLTVLALHVVFPVPKSDGQESVKSGIIEPTQVQLNKSQGESSFNAQYEESVSQSYNRTPEEDAFLSMVIDTLAPKRNVGFNLVQLPNENYGLIIQNDWLSTMIEVPNSDVANQQWSEISEEARWICQAEIAPVEKIRETLKHYELAMEQVYQSPQPPYYSDLKGLRWDKFEKKYVIVIMGEWDVAMNQCWRAILDVVSGNILGEYEIPCAVR